ncbi:carotenoid oxygenase [Linnemannia elongata]|nr:carotenoid oxygenase [Linnemannia elongata]
MKTDSSSQKSLKQGSLSAIPADIKIRTKERNSGHPHPYLNGNFYPVFEETVGDEGIECEVVGTIPKVLRGSQYIRTGPNALNVPADGAPHHFFTGEGMLHGVYFESEADSKGPIRPRYMNRYVRSDIFKKQNDHGYLHVPLGIIMTPTPFFKFIFHFVWFYIKMAWYKVTNIGDGNTALTYFGSRLLALHEGGKPVETAVPSLNTTGEYYFEEDLNKKDKNAVVTAHPKIDPKTGEMIFFSYSHDKPLAFYSVVSAEGKRKVWRQKVTLPKPSMMHDFATTNTYSIMLNCPMYFEPSNMLKGEPTLAFDPTAKARFGLIPRYYNDKSDKVYWFETRACHIFHTANAWDEKDQDGNIIAVCMTACRSEGFFRDINLWQPSGPDNYGGGKTEAERLIQHKAPGSGDYGSQDPDKPFLTLFRFVLATGETELTTLCQISSEFPVINFDRYMRPDLRYVFTASTEESAFNVGVKFNGIVKTDVQAVIRKKKELQASGKLKSVNVGGEGQWEIGAEALAAVQAQTGQSHRFGPHIYGNEAMFVANAPRADGQPLAEDDGFLLVYVYDERQMENGVPKDKARQVTELWIYDAKKVGQDIDPVAKVKIPRRVPYGFHGLHLTKEQIQENQEFLARRAAATAARA